MTGAGLAERMTEIGVPWDRSIVANLENGRRKTVSVVELLALARVLDVAPVHLLVPTEDDDAPYRMVPSSVVSAGRARAWIVGLFHLPSTDERLYYSEVPRYEWIPPGPPSDAQDRRAHQWELHQEWLREQRAAGRELGD